MIDVQSSGGRATATTEVRSDLRIRLQARRGEIEEAMLTRTYAISDPADADPAYRDGLRTAVSVALEYALEALERSEEHAPAPPPVLLAQARMAARSGVGLDAVLRRYLAGYVLFGDAVLVELARGNWRDRALPRDLLRGHAAVFDRLLRAVGEEYAREQTRAVHSTTRRLAERVDRLIAGEPVDVSTIGYGFDDHHVGVVASGPGAADAIRKLAATLDIRLLLVQRDELTVWAWLGSRRRSEPATVTDDLFGLVDGLVALAVGEPARGLSGWRLTHRQAAAAFPIALRDPGRCVRYADVALLASALQDDLLLTSLRRSYVEPVELSHADATIVKDSLRSYLATGCNISSAASALGVNRHTLAGRLRAVEERLGRSPSACVPELDLALSVDAFEGRGQQDRRPGQ